MHYITILKQLFIVKSLRQARIFAAGALACFIGIIILLTTDYFFTASGGIIGVTCLVLGILLSSPVSARIRNIDNYSAVYERKALPEDMVLRAKVMRRSYMLLLILGYVAIVTFDSYLNYLRTNHQEPSTRFLPLGLCFVWMGMLVPQLVAVFSRDIAQAIFAQPAQK